MSSQAVAVGHTAVALALVVAYVVVTLAGNDGTAVLGVLGGYAGGAGAQALATTSRTG